MAHVILLNGAPGCGKDTLANYLMANGTAQRKLSFKAPMFEIAMAMLGRDVFYEYMEAYNDRARKEIPFTGTPGMTPREFMIYISEKCIKPVFGNDYFGKRLVESIGDATCVVSDCGFAKEIHPILKAGHQVTLIRLHRQGFTFDGDSRSHIYLTPWNHGKEYTEHDVFLFDGEIKSAVETIKIISGLKK